MTRTLLATPIAMLLVTACSSGGGGGDSPPSPTLAPSAPESPMTVVEMPTMPPVAPPADDPTPAAPEQPPATLPPLNEGDDVTRLLDRTDDDCSISTDSAIALYGEPDSRGSEFFPDNFGSGITLATLLWSGISTEMELRSGEALDGCVISYTRGGPSIDVPAIETNPDPALPTSTAEAIVAASTGERTLVTDDPECVDTFTVLLRRYGEPTMATTFGPETSDDGATLVLLSWSAANGTLEYGPDIEGCEVTAFPNSTAPEPLAPVTVPAPSEALGTSEANPIIVANDPTCTAAVDAMIGEIGAPSGQTLLFPEETPNGTIQVLFFYELEGITGVLEQRPGTGSCHVYFLPGIRR